MYGLSKGRSLCLVLAICSAGCGLTKKFSKEGSELSQDDRIHQAIDIGDLNPSTPVKKNPKMLCDLADIHSLTHNAKLAESMYREALSMDKKFVPAYIGLSRMYANQGRMDQAVEIAEQGLKLNPKSPELHNHLGMIRGNQRKFDEAIECFRTALKHSPNTDAYVENLATMHAMKAEFPKALELYRKTKSEADARYTVAGVMWTLGYQEQSIEELRRVVAMEPNHPAGQKLAQLTTRPDSEILPASHEQVVHLKPAPTGVLHTGYRPNANRMTEEQMRQASAGAFRPPLPSPPQNPSAGQAPGHGAAYPGMSPSNTNIAPNWRR